MKASGQARPVHKRGDSCEGDAVEAEEDLWKQRSVLFFADESITDKDRKKRMRQLKVGEPRRASANWLHVVDHALVAGTGVGFERFDNVAAISNLKLPCKTVEPSAEMKDRIKNMSIPNCLVLCMDQESLQWCAYNFLVSSLQLTMVAWRDPFHRMWNDLHLAMRKAGYWTCYVHTTFIFNISFGPWQSQAWFEQQQLQAYQLAKVMSADDPLLLHLWPRILMDKLPRAGTTEGLATAGLELEDNANGRKGFIDNLLICRPFTVQGKRVRPSRWFSWHEAYYEWDEHFHTRALCFAALAINQGWVSNKKDLFDHESFNKLACDTKASGASLMGDAGDGSAKKATANAKNVLIKNKGKNGLHSCAKLSCDLDLTDNMRLLALGTSAQHECYVRDVKNLRGPDAACDIYHAWSCWDWIKDLQTAFRSCADLQGLAKAGLQVHFPRHTLVGVSESDCVVRVQDKLAENLVRLHACVASERTGSMLSHTHGWPEKLALFLKNETRESGMAALKEDWDTLCYASEHGLAGMRALTRQASLRLPLMQWVIVFAQCDDWNPESRHVNEIAGKLFRGWTQSRIVEEANQRLRAGVDRESSSKMLRMIRQWRIPTEANLIRGYNRREIRPVTQATCPANSMDSLFVPTNPHRGDSCGDNANRGNSCDAKKHGDSCDSKTRIEWYDKLETITKNIARWTSTPESEQERLANFELAKFLRKTDQALAVDDAWIAKLLPLWELHEELATHERFFVVKSWTNAVITWPAEQLEVNLYRPSLSCTRLDFRFCCDFEKYQIIPTKCLSPLHLVLIDYSKHLGALWRVTGAHVPILRWQCEHGFPGVSESALIATCKALKVITERKSQGNKTIIPEWHFDFIQKKGYCLQQV